MKKKQKERFKLMLFVSFILIAVIFAAYRLNLQATYEDEPTPIEPVDTTTMPDIISFSISPTTPTTADEVDVTSNIKYASTVYLYYDDGTFTEGYRVTMTMASVGVYYGKIPAKDAGTTVRYWIVAINDDGTTTSSIKSYVVSDLPSTETTTTVITYDVSFNVYKYVNNSWVYVPPDGVLSGTIKINATVTQGVDYVDAARISFWKVDNNDWLKVDETNMVASANGVFTVEYDTTVLENSIYDIRIELLDTGGGTVYEQSLFSNSGVDTTSIIDQNILYLMLAGFVSIGVITILLKQRV